MSINICKECGKEFEAKSPRILYCSAVHYRPCPVCGEPVVAKYLSDPPRRCEKCKGKSLPGVEKKPTKKPEPGSPRVGNIRKYKGHKMLGFTPGHEYELEIEWNGWSAYEVAAVYDITEDKPVDLMITLSSQKSIAQYFD